MKNNFTVYVFIISLFAIFSWLIIEKGKSLHPTAKIITETTTQPTADHLAQSGNTPPTLFEEIAKNIQHPFALLLLEIIIILACSRVFGALFSKLGQPAVVGEIISGIVLGPSILGLFYPEVLAFLFPKNAIGNLSFLSQIGLTFFMFLVGMELDLSKIKNKAKDALVISHSSIVVPFFLGVALSYFIYERFAPANVSFLIFSLFMGIAMSITAFPVLARIVKERELTKTSLGMMVISCAAADDVTAWCILAVVIAVAKAGSMFSALNTLIPAIGFILTMLYIIRPILNKVITKEEVPNENLNKTLVTVIFLTLLISAYFSEIIGIHSLFGAFLAGAIMPAGARVKELITEKVEDISVIVFLPIFFAVTGLRTQIGLLNERHLWITCVVVLMVAVLGKFGGSALSARLVGQSWKDSLSIGALMNTRGLMELVVLNIGYDLGILSPEIFAIMVLMALSTTFMTGPSLDLINYFFFKKINAERALFKN